MANNQMEYCYIDELKDYDYLSLREDYHGS